MSKKVIGIGVIGLGWMGRLHARSYKALAEHYAELDVEIRLVSICDPIEENRAFAVESLGFERTVEDYHDLLLDPDVDAVSICSPNYLHREIVLATAAAGKPFWIEKPMGVSAEQSRDIAVAAQDAGLVTCVGFNYRHVPAMEKARDLVRAGRLDNGAVGTLESSRVSVGPRAEYALEVYGTEGSLRWNFERMNELEVCCGIENEFQGYTRVMAGPDFPSFSHFQPGAGVAMGFDDLKTIEAAQFIQSILTGKQVSPSVADGWAAAEVDEATVASAADGRWHDVVRVTGQTTYDAV